MPRPALVWSLRHVEPYIPWSGMNWSSRNTTASTSPARGSRTRCRSQRNEGRNRSTRPTWFATPAVSTASTMRPTVAASGASGFSQNTATPAAAARSTRRACSAVQVHT